MFVVPEEAERNASPSSFDKIVGGSVKGNLHRFKIDLLEPSFESGVKAVNVLGQRCGRLDLQWSVIPDDFQARPGGRVPNSTPVDSSRSQRFVMQEASFDFGGGDRFSSFGAGRTFPVVVDGQLRLRVAAIGNMSEGVGKFSGLEGNYVFAGDLTSAGGFAGPILLRALDRNSVLRAITPLDPFVPSQADVRDFTPDTTYFLMRSQKSGPEQRTTFNIGPDGQVRGINVPQEFRHTRVDFSCSDAAGLQTQFEFGPTVGGEYSISAIDPTHPGPPGTPDSPSTFQGAGSYYFRDGEGRDVARFTVQFLEGRTFSVDLPGAPGQPAARFGFFGPILAGEGYFSEIDGMLLGIAGVTLMPHLFSGMQMLRLTDPNRKFLVS
jgi:hypothetical protein